MTTGLLCRRP